MLFVLPLWSLTWWFTWGQVSLIAQWVKNPPAIQELQGMWIQSLGWEDPLEKEMETHSRILAWKIPWTEEPGRLPSMGSQRVRVSTWAHTHIWGHDLVCANTYKKTDRTIKTKCKLKRLTIPSGASSCFKDGRVLYLRMECCFAVYSSIFTWESFFCAKTFYRSL